MIELYLGAFRQAILEQVDAASSADTEKYTHVCQVQIWVAERIINKFEQLSAKRDTLALFAAMVKQEETR